MADITVTITDTEEKSLQYACISVQDWADNVIKERARKAGDEIIDKLVKHCNENQIAIAVGRDAQITQAYDLGVVDTAYNLSLVSDEF